MNKRTLSCFCAACITTLMMAVPAGAATEQYTVTIRPGSIARFSDSFLEEYRSLGAEVTEKTGSIKVKVEPGEMLPLIPTEQDMVYQEDRAGKYVMTADWYTAETVTEDRAWVIQYDALVDAVEYKIRYVDVQSGEDVTLPLIAQGNVGTTYTFYSKEIDDYKCDTASQTLTLNADKEENILTFSYVSTAEGVETEEETIEDPVEEETTEDEGDSPQNNNSSSSSSSSSSANRSAAHTENNGGHEQTENTEDTEALTEDTGNEGEAIGDEDVPSGQQDTGDGEDGVNAEAISDGTVPLGLAALGRVLKENSKVLTVFGLLLLILFAVITAYYKRRQYVKKKNADGEKK